MVPTAAAAAVLFLTDALVQQSVTPKETLSRPLLLCI